LKVSISPSQGFITQIGTYTCLDPNLYTGTHGSKQQKALYRIVTGTLISQNLGIN